MGLSDVFGWFSSWPILFWVIVIGIVYVWLWRRGSEFATGRKPAMLFYGLSFLMVLDYAQRIGNAVNAPLPVTVLLLTFYGLGFYYIWKQGA